MNRKGFLTLISSIASLNAVDLGSITIDSSTIDEKIITQSSEVSTVNLVSIKEIQDINPKSVSEVLNKVAGVTMTLTGTDSIKVHIRGVDNQRYMGEKPGVAVVIDGVAVQETTGKINVDLDNIESIKVIKGSASYLYGNDALAGAVIITTKRQKATSSSSIESEAGSFGYKKLVATTNQALENSALQLQGSYRDSDGYWDDAFVNTKSINSKYQYYIDDSSDITIGADLTKRETGDGNSVRGVTEAQINPKSAGYYSYSGYYDSDLTKLFLTYSNDLNDDSNFMLRLHSYEDDKSYKSKRYTKDNSEIWNQNGAKGEYRTRVGKFALMSGFDLQRNETDETSYDILDGDAPRGGNDGDLLEKYKTKEDINAIYTEIKHKTTQNLTTTLNLRYDNIEHQYVDSQNSSNSVTPDYSVLSYRVGTNYTINSSNKIYTNISTGFRTPTVGQISRNQSYMTQNPDLNISTELDEETTYNYEIGLKGEKDNKLFYTISIFQLDRKDYIGRVAGSYITSDDENESNYDNVGDMRSRGLELNLNSSKTNKISYDLAYTYLDAKFTKYSISQQITEDPDGPYRPQKAEYKRVDLSGNYISRTPKHTIDLSLNMRVNEKFTLSPELYYKSSYYADEANRFKQGGYTVYNLRGKYNHNKSLEFFGKINNLFNKDYYEFVNVNSSALATMEDATIRVAQPRAFYVGARYKF